MWERLTIRRSTSGDGAAIRRLAALDSRPVPRGDALLVFVGDDLRAALVLETGATVADPFHQTADLLELLRTRAAQRDAGGRELRLRGGPAWRQAAEASP